MLRSVAVWCVPIVVLSAVMFPLWEHLLFPPPPPPPFEYTGSPFPVTNNGPYRPGESPEIVVGRCNHSAQTITYEISRTLVNVDTNQPTDLPVIAASVDPGCTTSLSRAHVIPRDMPPGHYYLRFLASYLPPGQRPGTPDNDSTKYMTTEARTVPFQVVSP